MKENLKISLPKRFEVLFIRNMIKAHIKIPFHSVSEVDTTP
jgi:hypothetical protein